MKHKSGNKVGYGASKAPADAYADNGQKDGKIEQETVLCRVHKNNQQKYIHQFSDKIGKPNFYLLFADHQHPENDTGNHESKYDDLDEKNIPVKSSLTQNITGMSIRND
jgi:hypothetical protein